jgi:hypothetical protein
MTAPSKSATSLKSLIKEAIQDLEVTPDEYRSIMELAVDDRHLDSEEKALLSQFHQMISNGTVQRVKG